jgi:N-hydroxyarylamine O-acetyltransferase
MHSSQIDVYLSRIGAARVGLPDLASLRDLQRRHLLSVPFENLSIHLAEPVSLEDDALFDKLVTRRRGGFCYELNGAFAALLTELGYRVTLLGASVHTGSGFGPPLDHLALRVDLDEPWLVDVGFGRFSTYPLRLNDRDPQTDPEGSFLLVEQEHGSIDIIRDGEPQYRLEPQPRSLSDFEPTCWYHTTSPKSHFTWSPACSLQTETGRITLSDRRLILTDGAERRERVLPSDDDVFEAYRTYFGVVLDRLPIPLHPKIA